MNKINNYINIIIKKHIGIINYIPSGEDKRCLINNLQNNKIQLVIEKEEKRKEMKVGKGE